MNHYHQNKKLPHPKILPPSIKVRSSQIADLEEVPHGIQRQALKLEDYHFPTHRLATTLTDDSKHPLVIVACGSFSPITYLHLRMFEMALDAITEQTRFEVIGGYYSPVSSNYKNKVWRQHTTEFECANWHVNVHHRGLWWTPGSLYNLNILEPR